MFFYAFTIERECKFTSLCTTYFFWTIINKHTQTTKSTRDNSFFSSHLGFWRVGWRSCYLLNIWISIVWTKLPLQWCSVYSKRITSLKWQPEVSLHCNQTSVVGFQSLSSCYVYGAYFNNHSPKWGWIVVNVYRAAKWLHSDEFIITFKW